MFAERTSGGYFIDVKWKREELARHGLSIEEAQNSGAECHRRGKCHHHGGGEGALSRQCPLSCRTSDQTSVRSDGLLVPALEGRRQIALNQLADIEVVSEPAMIRDEDGLLTGYVYVDIADSDPGSYIAEASEVLREPLQLPVGYALIWTGQYEAMQRVKERLTVIDSPDPVPYLPSSVYEHQIRHQDDDRLSGSAFSAVGAVWFLYLLGYNMSIAVWVGLMALLGSRCGNRCLHASLS